MDITLAKQRLQIYYKRSFLKRKQESREHYNAVVNILTSRLIKEGYKVNFDESSMRVEYEEPTNLPY